MHYDSIYPACYQTKIVRSSLEASVDVPVPADGFGWKMVDGNLEINWITCKPGPDECIELSYCLCPK